MLKTGITLPSGSLTHEAAFTSTNRCDEFDECRDKAALISYVSVLGNALICRAAATILIGNFKSR